MKIVFTRNDGRTEVRSPAPQRQVAKIFPEVLGMTDQEYIEFIKNRDVPKDAINVQIVPESSIPEERHFRNALKHDLTHDIDQCVAITQERLRREREPLLAALDVAFMKAQESGKPTKDITAEKQRLRDITLLPKASMTLDELKALKP
jgi:hypothetical protein